MTTSKLNVIILAAGQGTRMKSSLPKVLHPLGGKALLARVIEAANHLSPARMVVGGCQDTKRHPAQRNRHVD